MAGGPRDLRRQQVTAVCCDPHVFSGDARGSEHGVVGSGALRRRAVVDRPGAAMRLNADPPVPACERIDHAPREPLRDHRRDERSGRSGRVGLESTGDVVRRPEVAITHQDVVARLDGRPRTVGLPHPVAHDRVDPEAARVGHRALEAEVDRRRFEPTHVTADDVGGEPIRAERSELGHGVPDRNPRGGVAPLDGLIGDRLELRLESRRGPRLHEYVAALARRLRRRAPAAVALGTVPVGGTKFRSGLGVGVAAGVGVDPPMQPAARTTTAESVAIRPASRIDAARLWIVARSPSEPDHLRTAQPRAPCIRGPVSSRSARVWITPPWICRVAGWAHDPHSPSVSPQGANRIPRMVRGPACRSGAPGARDAATAYMRSWRQEGRISDAGQPPISLLGGLPGRHRRRPRGRRPRRPSTPATIADALRLWPLALVAIGRGPRPSPDALQPRRAACSPRRSRARCSAARSPSRRASRSTAASRRAAPTCRTQQGTFDGPARVTVDDRLRRRSSSTPRPGAGWQFDAGNTADRTPIVDASARVALDRRRRPATAGTRLRRPGRDALAPDAADDARSTTCRSIVNAGAGPDRPAGAQIGHLDLTTNAGRDDRSTCPRPSLASLSGDGERRDCCRSTCRRAPTSPARWRSTPGSSRCASRAASACASTTPAR